jgi:hypothetical protein
MDRVYHAEGTEPLQISAQTVFDTVKAIVSSGHEQAFIAKCNEVDAFVSVEPRFVNLVKDYLFENKSLNTMDIARDLVRSARCQRG